MFDILNKYKNKGHFFLNPTDALEEKCNAPADKSGVYLVYELKNGRINLVYVGSGVKNDLKQNIINGPKPANIRAQSWPVKMLSENIDALDIYWWVVENGKDNPADIARSIMSMHKFMFDANPKWNTLKM